MPCISMGEGYVDLNWPTIVGSCAITKQQNNTWTAHGGISNWSVPMVCTTYIHRTYDKLVGLHSSELLPYISLCVCGIVSLCDTWDTTGDTCERAPMQLSTPSELVASDERILRLVKAISVVRISIPPLWQHSLLPTGILDPPQARFLSLEWHHIYLGYVMPIFGGVLVVLGEVMAFLTVSLNNAHPPGWAWILSVVGMGVNLSGSFASKPLSSDLSTRLVGHFNHGGIHQLWNKAVL